MNKKIVAFIPVRGGSKSIPLKNIREMNGQPLIYWTIDAAVYCQYIDEVYVSTDSEQIHDIVSNYNKKNAHKLTCIGRSKETATDTATTESAMLEFANNYNFDSIILIQATSPLLESDDLEKAIKKYNQENYDSLLSLVRQKRFIWEAREREVKPKNYDVFNRPRRQDFAGFLIENGAFYITKRELLLKTGSRISGNIGYHEMGEDSYYEIDELNDWLIVEQLMKKKKQNSTDIFKKLQEIKLFATDCDGVLTDAGMYYTEQGDELKKFNTKDGMGIGLLRKKGIKTAIITGENSTLVERRGEKIGIDNVFLGITDKVKIMEGLLKKYNITYEQVAYVGDDINDLELLRKVGVSFSVKDAVEVVKRNVDYITNAKGGEGAVREIAEMIIQSKG